MVADAEPICGGGSAGDPTRRPTPTQRSPNFYPSDVPAPETSSGKVLVVDDDADARVVQTAMLAGLRYTGLRDAILTHPTMAEGLNVLLTNGLPMSADEAAGPPKGR